MGYLWPADEIKMRGYFLFFAIVLILCFAVRVIPALNNNFHFTMDQGDDAVHVREIVERGQLLLHGPETNMTGVYTGPLWYYFLAFGYILFNGHPIAAVFLLIVLSVVLTALLMWKIAKSVNKRSAIFVGVGLQFYWWFYDISRYGFNPFPLVFLSVLLILLLTKYLEGERNAIVWAAVPVGLAFHAEVAGATSLLIFYTIISGYLLIRKKLSFRRILFIAFVLSFFFIPNILYEFQGDTSQVVAIKTMLFSKESVFAENRFQRVSVAFLEFIAQSSVPQAGTIGLIVVSTILYLFWKQKKKNIFVLHFVSLAIVFFASSWIWFASGTGWRTWHTVSVPVVLYISLLLMISVLKRPVNIALGVIVLAAQFFFFQNLYAHFLLPLKDESLLRNEIAAIDWIYKESGGKGFYVYNYLPSVRDYSHQYLFWWYGRKNYGYVPCEYGRYPGIPDFFVPGYKYYQKPKKPCANLRFLLMEPDKNIFIKRQWYQGVSENSWLLESARFGALKVEKRSFGSH